MTDSVEAGYKPKHLPERRSRTTMSIKLAAVTVVSAAAIAMLAAVGQTSQPTSLPTHVSRQETRPVVAVSRSFAPVASSVVSRSATRGDPSAIDSEVTGTGEWAIGEDYSIPVTKSTEGEEAEAKAAAGEAAREAQEQAAAEASDHADDHDREDKSAPKENQSSATVDDNDREHGSNESAVVTGDTVDEAVEKRAARALTCSGLVDCPHGWPTDTTWPESEYAETASNGSFTDDSSELDYGDSVFFEYNGRHRAMWAST